MSGEKAEQLSRASQIMFEKSEVAEFEGEPNKLSYNLNIVASSITAAICNQIRYSESQATDLESNNKWFLPFIRDDKKSIVVRSKDKVNNNYIVYDAYTLYYDWKGQFTETEPKPVGSWVTVDWKVEYTTELLFNSDGSAKIDPATGLQMTKKTPIGLWPENGTEVLLVYHSREELEPIPSLASNKRFMVLTADVAERVEEGKLIVTFNALSGTLIDK